MASTTTFGGTRGGSSPFSSLHFSSSTPSPAGIGRLIRQATVILEMQCKHCADRRTTSLQLGAVQRCFALAFGAGAESTAREVCLRMRPAQVGGEVFACDASSEDGVALRAEERIPDGRNLSKRAICLPLECASAQHILGSSWLSTRYPRICPLVLMCTRIRESPCKS